MPDKLKPGQGAIQLDRLNTRMMKIEMLLEDYRRSLDTLEKSLAEIAVSVNDIPRVETIEGMFMELTQAVKERNNDAG